jgi:lipoprotein-anchoring transpeptidase ErfK/SrfK
LCENPWKAKSYGIDTNWKPYEMKKNRKDQQIINRREFLELSGLCAGALFIQRIDKRSSFFDLPESDLIGRNCTGGIVTVRSKPDVNSAVVKEVYEDTLFPWLREVSATNPDYNHFIQRWVETPDGFVYSPTLQPVRNLPNDVVTGIQVDKGGFWAEVTIPYVDIYLDNPPARSPGLKALIENGLPTRLYFSQVMWIDQVKTGNSGNIVYRVNENEKHGYGYGDVFWAIGNAFRPLTNDEVAPISPDLDPAEKIIKINLTDQTLSCFERGREVFFCRVSTGGGEFSTPTGDFPTWRKTFTLHMAAGTVDAGYDTPGVSWTNLFIGTGVAIHATFWHNQFGEKRSHGCVNCRPEDAKWIFRWTTPVVSLDDSDIQWSDWQQGSTRVLVEERLY